MVQFAGFPRSGHSLVGSLLDAHPSAVVSHELDVMGLLRRGLSGWEILALIAWNARTFTRHGRYWNNFCYAVPSVETAARREPRVVGDKKGDWAVRWFQRDPTLLQTLARRFPGLRRRWILILRNPWDNISTLALRRGGAYDRLRIESGSEEQFRRRLGDRQGTDLPDRVTDETIEDYLGLCDGIEAMKAVVPGEDWLEVEYDSFVADPITGIRDLCRFLDLEPDRDYLAAAASIVRPRPHRSRRHIGWAPEQIHRVRRAIGERAILRRFASLPEPPGTVLGDD